MQEKHVLAKLQTRSSRLCPTTFDVPSNSHEYECHVPVLLLQFSECGQQRRHILTFVEPTYEENESRWDAILRENLLDVLGGQRFGKDLIGSLVYNPYLVG